MSETGRVIELDWAYLVVGKDELSIIQKDGVEDCPKVRFATKTGNSGGAFSWNRHVPASGDPFRMEEQILFQGKFGDEQDYQGPMLRVDMNTGDASDKAMQPIFKLSWKELWSAVPINAPGGTAGVPWFLRAPGAQTEFHCQGDRPVVVCYDTSKGHPWRVVWSIDEFGFHKG